MLAIEVLMQSIKAGSGLLVSGPDSLHPPPPNEKLRRGEKELFARPYSFSNCIYYNYSRKSPTSLYEPYLSTEGLLRLR